MKKSSFAIIGLTAVFIAVAFFSAAIIDESDAYDTSDLGDEQNGFANYTVADSGAILTKINREPSDTRTFNVPKYFRLSEGSYVAIYQGDMQDGDVPVVTIGTGSQAVTSNQITVNISSTVKEIRTQAFKNRLQTINFDSECCDMTFGSSTILLNSDGEIWIPPRSTLETQSIPYNIARDGITIYFEEGCNILAGQVSTVKSPYPFTVRDVKAPSTVYSKTPIVDLLSHFSECGITSDSKKAKCMFFEVYEYVDSPSNFTDPTGENQSLLDDLKNIYFNGYFDIVDGEVEVLQAAVTMNLSGGSSASISADEGWDYDPVSQTWSKSFLSGVEFPSIEAPTKDAEGGYAYILQQWEPVLPTKVTESASYEAIYELVPGAGFRFTVDNLTYSVVDPVAKTAKVVGYESEPVGALIIPDSVEYGGIEYAVSGVARAAFVDCTKITSLTLHANTELHAFYRCYGLESITICEGVTSIGTSTFAYSDALRHVEFPSTLEEVGVNAFYKYTFYGMDGTKLARTAENFVGKIFEGSSKILRESFVADGLKYTFKAGDSPSVKLMGYTEEPEGELVVPASVEYGGAEYPVASVAQDAFRGCGGITSVVLGTNAGLHSFYRCSGLESLTISEGVTWIGVSAFAYCDGLTSVEFPSTMAKISSNAFYRCSGLESLVLNGGALEIGVSAFAYCDGIGHIEFAPTLAKIGTNAFYKFAFYDADGAKLAKSPANLAGKTFEGESKALYQVS